MKPLAYIWWRAFSIVTCTALNVSQVAGGRYHAAFFTGGVLSWIWWQNTKTAAHTNVRGSQAAYALGAACGTMFGMYLGSLLRQWTTN